MTATQRAEKAIDIFRLIVLVMILALLAVNLLMSINAFAIVMKQVPIRLVGFTELAYAAGVYWLTKGALNGR